MASETIPVWLDCDPGHDDAFAILLAAHHPSLRLLGISTVYGNATLSAVTTNALSILKAIGKSDTVAVHPGKQNPFSRDAVHAPDIHGESGLDGTDLLPQPDRRALTDCNAILDMRDSLMACQPDTAWLVATGPLTNVGLLFAVFPEVAGHIKGLSIMGGAIGGQYTGVYMGPEYTDENGTVHARIGNTTPFAEFNIWCDPDAAKSIFSNPTLKSKVAMITLDLSHQVCATQQVRDTLLYAESKTDSPTRLRKMFNDLLLFFQATYEEVFNLKDPPLHDPLAVAVLLAGTESNLFDDGNRERWEVQIITEGEQVGRTVASAAPHGVYIPKAINESRFWQLIETCMKLADASTGQVAV